MNPDFGRMQRAYNPGNTGECWADGAHLPGGTEERLIACGVVTIRCAMRDGVPAMVVLEARHPGAPGTVRTFDISNHAREAWQRSPLTVRQVVDLSSSSDMRLDALKVMTRHVAREAEMHVYDSPPGPAFNMRDIFEPSFAVSNRVGTEWGDVVRGYQRLVVSVLRNQSPFVEFSIVENDRGEVVSSLVNLIPVEVRWPLLNERGEPAGQRDISQTIDSYIAVLQRAAGFQWPQALEQLAVFQESRMRIADGDSVVPGMCVADVSLGARTESLFAGHLEFSKVASALAPFGIEGDPVVLPDRRVVWISNPELSPADNHVVATLGGFSECGVPYAVELRGPNESLDRMWRAISGIKWHKAWGDIEKGCIDLAKVPAIEFRLSEPGGREEYPSSINSLMNALKSPDEGRCVGVGLSRPLTHYDAPFHARVMSALVRGYVPIHAVGPQRSLGSTWVCEAFLDEALTGQVVLTNKLGGRIVASVDADLVSVGERLELLRAFIGEIYENPEMLSSRISRHAALEIHSADLPHVIDDAAYRVMDTVAQMWRAPTSAARSSAFDSTFRSERLRDGRWALTKLQDRETRAGRFDSTTLVIGACGVEELYLTCGTRSSLGELRGTRVRPSTAVPAFRDVELIALLKEVSGREQNPSDDHFASRITATIPHLRVDRRCSMRHVDSERSSLDVVFRIKDWFLRLLGMTSA